MHEQVSTYFLENTRDAIVFLNIQGHVLFWNKGAELLFGYTREEVYGKLLPFLIKDALNEWEFALEKARNGNQFSFKTQKRHKLGNPLDLLVHARPVIEDNVIIGYSLIFQEMELIKKATFVPYNLQPFLREQKRTFVEIREKVILTLSTGRMTINQLATNADINWRTVEKHLTFLIGKRCVAEIFSSEYVRIFELTQQGLAYAEELKAREFCKFVK